MLNEFLNKQITVPLYRYEQLIENETRYNQLFEWQHEHGYDDILKVIDEEKLKDLIGQIECVTSNEESATTEEVDSEIKVGDKVRILENNVNAPLGVVGTIVTIKDNGYLQIEDDKDKYIIWILPDKKYVEKVYKGEEN